MNTENYVNEIDKYLKKINQQYNDSKSWIKTLYVVISLLILIVVFLILWLFSYHTTPLLNWKFFDVRP